MGGASGREAQTAAAARWSQRLDARRRGTAGKLREQARTEDAFSVLGRGQNRRGASAGWRVRFPVAQSDLTGETVRGAHHLQPGGHICGPALTIW